MAKSASWTNQGQGKLGEAEQEQAIPSSLVKQFDEIDRPGLVIQEQLALELFSKNTPITDDVDDNIRLKKNNSHIRIVGNLRNLERRLVNALYFVARPRVLADSRHQVDLDYLKWLINSRHHDNKHLKETLDNIINVKVKLNRNVINYSEEDGKPTEVGEQYFVTPLVYDVGFDTTQNVFFFRIPESLRPSLARPERYTWISMRLNATFKGKHSLTMYELLASWQYRGATPIWTIAEFRELMGIDDDDYPDFKRLSERVIKGGLQEITAHTNFVITPEYYRENRVVTKIQFKITEKEKTDGHHSQQVESIFPQDLFIQLRDDWLLSISDIEKISKEYSEEKIREKIQVLRFRYVEKGKPIHKRSALLMKALENDEEFRLATDEIAALSTKQKVEQAKKQARAKELERTLEEKVDALQKKSLFTDIWSAMDSSLQLIYWAEFLAVDDSKVAKIGTNLIPDVVNIDNLRVRDAFARWLLKKLGNEV